MEIVMKIFNAGMTLPALMGFCQRYPHHKPDVLLSYPLLPTIPRLFTHKHRHLIGGLFLDNGAFGANQPDSTLDADELYAKFKTYCEYSGKDWDLVFSFDRNFGLNGYAENMEYQKELEQLGIPVVTTLHNIYNDDVNKIIARGLPEHKVVAIGQCDGREIYANIKDPVMKIYNAGGKVHFFGAINFDLFCRLPIYTCDASSWSKYPAYGFVLYWNPKREKLNKTDKLYFPKLQDGRPSSGAQYYNTYEYLKDFKEYLWNNLKFQIRDLLGDNNEDNRRIANIFYYSQLEKIIGEKQLAHGFDTSD